MSSIIPLLHSIALRQRKVFLMPHVKCMFFKWLQPIKMFENYQRTVPYFPICSEIQFCFCAIRGKEVGVHSSHPQPGFPIMCDKKGRCKVPGCNGTPKMMCKKFNVHLCLSSYFGFHMSILSLTRKRAQSTTDTGINSRRFYFLQ